MRVNSLVLVRVKPGTDPSDLNRFSGFSVMTKLILGIQIGQVSEHEQRIAGPQYVFIDGRGFVQGIYYVNMIGREVAGFQTLLDGPGLIQAD